MNTDPTAGEIRFQIDALDGLRGLAVLIVFFAHTANVDVVMLPGVDFSGIGKAGVFLFFLLSAFLLTVVLIQAGRRVFDGDYLLHYFNRRFFRIYPLYFLYLLLGVITTALLWRLLDAPAPMGLPFRLTPQEGVQHLLLQQGKGVTWSILVEFRYYFLLPVVAAVHSVLLRQRLLPCLAATTLGIFASGYLWPADEYLPNDPRLGFYLPVFLIGSLLAVVHLRWQNSPLARDRRLQWLIEASGLLALLTLMLMTPSIASLIAGRPLSIDHFHKSFILFALLWSLVLLACVHGGGILGRLFRWRALRFLGLISYSIYLIHMMVIDVTMKYAPHLPAVGWIMLALTIVASWLSWKLIERPMAGLRVERCFRKLRPRAVS